MTSTKAVPWRLGQSGQALTEFALVSTVLALLLGGAIELGSLYAHKIELAGAARAGARWAAGHSSAWSAAASPPSSTVEGQVREAGATPTVPNDDSHIVIEYFDAAPVTPVLCGRYRAATGSFSAQAGYTQSSCVAAGNLVRVTVTSQYPLLTTLLGGLFGTSVSVSGVATMPVTG